MAVQTGQSHSWWFASKDRLQSSTTQSPWLSLMLSELEERIRQMLNLMEGDADSFAERAEMYYKKRPQLVNMIEDFYRAHRSLAEQYDQLKSSLAVRRSISVLPSYLDKSWSQSLSNTEPDEEHKSLSDPFDFEGSEVDDPDQEEAGVEDKLREMPDEGTSSYLVEQKDELVQRHKDELESLKEENAILKAEILGKNEEIEVENKLGKMQDGGTASYLVEQRDMLIVNLKDELEGLKEENAKLKAEIAEKNVKLAVENKMREMPDEGSASSLVIQKDHLIVKLEDELEALKEENENLKAEIAKGNQEIEVENKLREMPHEGTASYLVEQKDELVEKLKDELEVLKEETEKLKAEIVRTEAESKLRKIPDEGAASYLVEQNDELVEKLKDDLEGLKEENVKLRAEIARKDEVTEVEDKLRVLPDEETVSCLVEQNELVEKLKDELEVLKEENAKLKADTAGGKNEETEAEDKLRKMPDERTAINIVEQNDELALKLKDELERLEEENAKLKAEIVGKNEVTEVECNLTKMPDEGTSGYLVEQIDELLEKLKDELEGLKEENGKLKAEIVAKNEEKREVIRQLAFSLEILKEENLILRRCIKEPAKNNCTLDLKKLSRRLFAGIPLKFQSTIVVAL